MTEGTVKFGYHKNGRMSICKAKPGNEGRYGCPHDSHVDLTREDLKSGIVERTNEESFQRELAELGVEALVSRVRGGAKARAAFRKKHGLPESTKSEPSLPLDNFLAQVKDRRGILPQRDPELIDGFIDSFVARLQRAPETLSLAERKGAMNQFISSDDEQMNKMREYLGEQDLSRIGGLLSEETSSMVRKVRFSGNAKNRTSLQRTLLTNLNNDMDSRNYMRSVLYFKGRCCYCDERLWNSGDKESLSPTGEHLTPVSPEKKDELFSGTRYGNMALACAHCNRERGNSPLERHLWRSPRLPDERKPEILARIELFREFAGYREYNALERRKINHAIRVLNLVLKKQLRTEMNSGGASEFRAELTHQLNWLSRSTLSEREDILRNYDNNWLSAKQWYDFTTVPLEARGVTVKSIRRIKELRALKEKEPHG